MYTYAISLGSAGGVMTAELEAAFDRSRLFQTELDLGIYVNGGDPDGQSAARTRKMLRENRIRALSAHLPFYGREGKWDLSAPDEGVRATAVASVRRLLERYPEFAVPELTLHGSSEVPLDEHPNRIRQLRQSLRELLPTAEKFGTRFNVELLPRLCIGRDEAELAAIVADFPPERVGIVIDVNHVMTRCAELPTIIDRLAPRTHIFHLSDYDGVDETHWFPGQGVIDWRTVMSAIRRIDHPVTLILETQFLLEKCWSHVCDPYFTLRETESAIWFLEHCEAVMAERFRAPFPGGRPPRAEA